MAILSPTIVQLHGVTTVRTVRTTTVPLFKMDEENGPKVEYLFLVRSKRNAIFLHTIFSTMELISKYQAVKTQVTNAVEVKAARKI